MRNEDVGICKKKPGGAIKGKGEGEIKRYEQTDEEWEDERFPRISHKLYSPKVVTGQFSTVMLHQRQELSH